MASRSDSSFRMLDDKILTDKKCIKITNSVNEAQSDRTLIPIACEEHGRLQIKQDALERILSNPVIGDRPISIISIAGQYRTGKSFLLNFFMRYLRNKGWENSKWIGDESTKVADGIDWEKGTEAHTKGILMWPEVFLVEDNEKETAVLLMDTQGLFDTDTGSDTNARILSVSTLLSSHQILNIMSRIEVRDLEHLQLCSNHAKAATRNPRIRGDDAKKPFQRLTFLVRDWRYDDEHIYGDGGMGYLDGILKQTSKCAEVNNIRKSIGEVFNEVQCFLMPHPGKKVLRKSKMSVTNEDLDEDFYNFVKQFAEKVLHPSNLVTKKFAGKTTTTNEIMELISTVANCFRRGQIPEVKSLYEEAAHSFSKKVMEKSAEKYKVEIEKDICKQAVSDDQLEKYHANALKKVKQIFQRNATFGSDDVKIQYLRQTEEICNNYFAEIELQNKRLLREQSTAISTLIEKCFKRYQSDMDKALKKVLSQYEFRTCHNRHRGAAVNCLERELGSLSLSTDRFTKFTTDLDNKISTKYQEFQSANQQRLDLEERNRQLADLRRKKKEMQEREERERKKRKITLIVNESNELFEEFLLSIRDLYYNNPEEWWRLVNQQCPKKDFI